MYSFSIDYLFNRVYDVLLWIKYTWFFTLLRNDPQNYLASHENVSWDGLRDRGWFDDYFRAKSTIVPSADIHISLWQRMLEALGLKLPDSDGDGIPDVTDPLPYNAGDITQAQLKERYQLDYTFSDRFRDFFGIGPKDSDNDGVPDSYEIAHGMNPKNPDSDSDGLFDGQELLSGTDPLNPDTDHDGVLDGRDEAPLDQQVSSIGLDSDGDGVSDKIEKLLGTDIHNKDTDADGIPDGLDTYPLDPNNISQIAPFDISKNTGGLHLSIQNPVLSLFTDFLSVLAIIIIVVFVYVLMRWFIVFIKSLNHYEHHFGDHGGAGDKIHSIKDNQEESLPAGILNLPILEENLVEPPTVEEFKNHPRIAVIRGYMSSSSEALWRIGIMEADNLLLETLHDKGYQGEGVAEALAAANFQTVDLARDAHRVRNRIAHQGSDFELTSREAKRVFVLYESVLRELKLIG